MTQLTLSHAAPLTVRLLSSMYCTVHAQAEQLKALTLTVFSTVGSAAICSDGRIFTGINVFHFSGGPCAENVALANATAAGVASALSPGVGDGAQLTTIVAVTNDDRGVISPCGRCRQMMFDFYPDIQVIVRDGSELRVVGMTDLLPFAYKRVN